MKVHEFGDTSKKTMVMFNCSLEPWWAFEESARAMAQDFHVLLMMDDGHSEEGKDFISIERNVEQAADHLRRKGIGKVDLMYGVSMGGSSVLRFLATQEIPVKKAIVDAGITPYSHPRILCRLIAIRDFLMYSLAIRSYSIMKKAAPPERWTPEGQDPEEHYRRIFEFEKTISSRSVYNIFWSANNYSMPDPVPKVDTRIEYWYGEAEKKAREDNMRYVCETYPQTVTRQMDGLEHAELVLMFPERFHEEAMRFYNEK